MYIDSKLVNYCSTRTVSDTSHPSNFNNCCLHNIQDKPKHLQDMSHRFPRLHFTLTNGIETL